MCWLCKHLTWLKLRQKLTDMLGHTVPPDDISWVTVVNRVLEPSPRALHRPMSEFRSLLTEAANAWNVTFFGRFEVDLVLNPRPDLAKNTFKQETLRALGLNDKSSHPVAILHAHLIAYHPGRDRGWLSCLLKQRLTEPRRTDVSGLDIKQLQPEALDNLTRYPLKTLPPDGTLSNGRKFFRPLNPEALRLHNKLINVLAGENGECSAAPNQEAHDA
jgi:hypothetical protein